VRYYHIFLNQVKVMSTIQVIKKWLPKPSKNLVESLPVKEGKKLPAGDVESLPRSPLSIADLMELSWVLSDD